MVLVNGTPTLTGVVKNPLAAANEEILFRFTSTGVLDATFAPTQNNFLVQTINNSQMSTLVTAGQPGSGVLYWFANGFDGAQYQENIIQVYQ